MARRDFRYRAPNPSDLDKIANQSGFEFKGFIKDHLRRFRPGRGESRLRILPQEDAAHYAMTIWVHYAVGPDSASVLCLHHMKKEKCPLCEDRAKAERRGDDETAQQLRPVRRALLWVIDRNEERDGPKLWDMPYTIERDLAKLARDRKTGEIFAIDHPDEGYDVTFDKEGEGRQTKYAGMAIARRPSSVDDEWLDYVKANPLPECIVWRDYDAVQELYQGVTGRREERSTGREERRPEPRREPREEAETPASKTTDAYDEGEQEAVRGEPDAKTKSTVAALRERIEARRGGA